jgi:hypothetical protein
MPWQNGLANYLGGSARIHHFRSLGSRVPKPLGTYATLEVGREGMAETQKAAVRDRTIPMGERLNDLAEAKGAFDAFG